MWLALTHEVSPDINQCVLSFLDWSEIEYEKAAAQHASYCAMLRDSGLEVIELTANKEDPDGTFIEDNAVVVDEIALMASMGVESRRSEVDAVESVLSEYRKTVRIEDPATLEGGDVLQVGKKIFIGISLRTNLEGVRAVMDHLEPFGYEIIPARVSGVLHLKSAITALDDETMLANPKRLDLKPFKNYRVVHVPDDEPLAANVLRIDDMIFMHEGFTKTIEMVEGMGYKVKTTDMSELLKAESGLTCSSIVLKV